MAVERSALLVVDMQNDFCLPSAPLFVPGAPAVIAAVIAAVDAARARGVPVVWVVREHHVSGVDAEVTRAHLYKDGKGPVALLTPGKERRRVTRLSSSSTSPLFIINISALCFRLRARGRPPPRRRRTRHLQEALLRLLGLPPGLPATPAGRRPRRPGGRADAQLHSGDGLRRSLRGLPGRVRAGGRDGQRDGCGPGNVHEGREREGGRERVPCGVAFSSPPPDFQSTHQPHFSPLTTSSLFNILSSSQAANLHDLRAVGVNTPTLAEWKATLGGGGLVALLFGK